MDENLNARIDLCVQKLGGSIKAEMLTGIPKSTLNRWSQPGGPDVPTRGIRQLGQAAGVSIDWIVTGRGSPDGPAEAAFLIPLYDVRLAAGGGRFSDVARVIAEIPIDRDLLKQLGRTNADGLAWVGSDGDSMAPTIPDGSRVLMDTRDTRIREGVFGFRLGERLRLKRLRPLTDAVDLISDNHLYPPERLEGHELDEFQVIGKALLGVVFL
jgi:phage repressor protein C with HTH and peptisase S24 domain